MGWRVGIGQNASGRDSLHTLHRTWRLVSTSALTGSNLDCRTLPPAPQPPFHFLSSISPKEEDRQNIGPLFKNWTHTYTKYGSMGVVLKVLEQELKCPSRVLQSVDNPRGREEARGRQHINLQKRKSCKNRWGNSVTMELYTHTFFFPNPSPLRVGRKYF